VNEITTLEQLEDALAASQQQPVFLFKHSTACPVSAGAHEKVRQYLNNPNGGEKPTFYLIKVIESRPVSNAIEEKLAVRHQSPQLLLVKGGQAVWNASHYGIHGDAIAEALRNS
jgi:bacillithiol system protein YtxJ